MQSARKYSQSQLVFIYLQISVIYFPTLLLFVQMMYLKAKDVARKESQHISLTDLEMDDIGFSGPLSKTSDTVFNEFTNNDEDGEGSGAITPIDTGLHQSPQVKRVSSFGNLRTQPSGNEVRENTT